MKLISIIKSNENIPSYILVLHPKANFYDSSYHKKDIFIQILRIKNYIGLFILCIFLKLLIFVQNINKSNMWSILPLSPIDLHKEGLLNNSIKHFVKSLELFLLDIKQTSCLLIVKLKGSTFILRSFNKEISGS